MPLVKTVEPNGSTAARDLLALDYKQNAVPISPSAGERWLRINDSTGLSIEPESGAFWERDSTNTYWLSQAIYSLESNATSASLSASTNNFRAAGYGTHDFWFLSLETSFLISTTHNSANYWQADFSCRDTSNVETAIASRSSWSTGRTINVWYRDRVAINSHLDISAVLFGATNLRYTKVGSAGNLFGSMIIYYRLARAV